MSVLRKIGLFNEYAIGIWLIAIPWLFQFAWSAAPTFVSVVTGSGVIIYNAFGNYEGGVLKFVPAGLHYLVEIITGVLLSLSPWLFDYSDVTFWPHFLTGFFCVCMALVLNRARQRKEYSS
jgi:hypothetical protein